MLQLRKSVEDAVLHCFYYVIRRVEVYQFGEIGDAVVRQSWETVVVKGQKLQVG